MVPKSKLDDKIQEVKDLQNQLNQRDKDLKVLKKDAEGNEDLQKSMMIFKSNIKMIAPSMKLN